MSAYLTTHGNTRLTLLRLKAGAAALRTAPHWASSRVVKKELRPKWFVACVHEKGLPRGHKHGTDAVVMVMVLAVAAAAAAGVAVAVAVLVMVVVYGLHLSLGKSPNRTCCYAQKCTAPTLQTSVHEPAALI